MRSGPWARLVLCNKGSPLIATHLQLSPSGTT